MTWHIVRVEAKGNPMGMMRDVLMVRVRSIHRPATEEAVQSEEFDGLVLATVDGAYPGDDEAKALLQPKEELRSDIESLSEEWP